MSEAIIQAIRRLGRFSASDTALLGEKLRVITLPGKAFLLRAGEVCRCVYFLNHGSLRHYCFYGDQEERTLNLWTEHDWVLDQSSFTSQKPATNFIQACEECEVLVLDVHALHELIERSPAFLQLGKLLETGSSRPAYDPTTSPEERYAVLLAEKPQLLLRFPLKHIASLLGMTPETLSRVRRRIK